MPVLFSEKRSSEKEGREGLVEGRQLERRQSTMAAAAACARPRGCRAAGSSPRGSSRVWSQPLSWGAPPRLGGTVSLHYGPIFDLKGEEGGRRCPRKATREGSDKGKSNGRTEMVPSAKVAAGEQDKEKRCRCPFAECRPQGGRPRPFHSDGCHPPRRPLPLRSGGAHPRRSAVLAVQLPRPERGQQQRESYSSNIFFAAAR